MDSRADQHVICAQCEKCGRSIPFQYVGAGTKVIPGNGGAHRICCPYYDCGHAAVYPWADMHLMMLTPAR